MYAYVLLCSWILVCSVHALVQISLGKFIKMTYLDLKMWFVKNKNKKCNWYSEYYLKEQPKNILKFL